jgi:hypothetical protein
VVLFIFTGVRTSGVKQQDSLALHWNTVGREEVLVADDESERKDFGMNKSLETVHHQPI